MENQAKTIVDTSKYIYNRKLTSGKAGNVSSRFKGEDGDIIAITPTLKSLKNLNEQDIVLLDLDGNVLSKGKPSSEVNLHLSIYKKRKDINGIIHSHSPYATGFAFSEKKIKGRDRFEKISGSFLIDVEYEDPGSEELAISASKAAEHEDVIILKNHGVICMGSSLDEACELSEFIEDIAKTQFITYMLNLHDSI